MKAIIYWVGVLFVILQWSCTSLKVQKSFQKSSLAHQATGLLIEELESKKVIFSHQADHFFMPASNTKLLTFLQANRILPDSIPAFAYKETQDTLFFWGTGDPSFLHTEFGQSALLSFLRNSEKVLAYCEPKSHIPALGAGWAWDDYNDYYSAEISYLPLYGNVASFSSYGAGKWEIVPRYFSDEVVKGKLSYVKRDRYENTFEIPTLIRDPYKKQAVPMITSPELTMNLLVDTLKKPLVYLSRNKDLNAKIFYTGNMDDLYIPLLHESDNFVAEQLLLMIGAVKYWNGGAEDVIKNLAKEPGNEFLTTLKWVDGSGLSRYNLMRPHDFITILRKLIAEIPEKRLFKLLPATGISGTLRSIKLTNQASKIWAKSGSFNNTYNLSGIYQNAKGKKYVFSMLTNLANRPVSESKKAVLELLNVLN